MTIYAMSSYQRASGTRSAFAAFSAALVAEGFPPITVNSGDREPEVQEAIFRSKFVPSSGPKDVGPYSDRKYWPGHGYWKRVVGGGTVGVPLTSNHEKRRAADLAAPYNAITPAHRRAQVLAKRFNITCEGLGFAEAWHWTYWGDLGVIGSPSAGGAASPAPTPTPAPIEEDEMYLYVQIQGKLTTWILWIPGRGKYQTTQDEKQALKWRALVGKDARILTDPEVAEFINVAGLFKG